MNNRFLPHRYVLMLGCVCTILCGTVYSQSDSAKDEARLMDTAQRILKQSPLIDGHNDAPWQVRKYAKNDLDVLDLESDTSILESPMKTDLPRLRKGGVGAQFWVSYIPSTEHPQDAVVDTLEQFDLIHRMMVRYSDTLVMARTANQIVRIHKSGKVASLIAIEGGHAIANSLPTLRMLYELGARYMTLTHSHSIDWADSATDSPKAHGLTDFGKDVILEMNRLGMMVDLSHASTETMHAVLDCAKAPVIFSHSNAYGVCHSNRNVPDDVLLRVKENNGIVMVVFVPLYLIDSYGQFSDDYDAEEERVQELWRDEPERVRQYMKEWEEKHPRPVATVGDVADHIDYMVKLIGIDHVGIGSDFDGFRTPVQGLEDVSKFPNLVVELLRRGYSEKDVMKITGENFLRVMRDCETVAQEMAAK